MARRGYPPEFRQRVIELVQGGRRGGTIQSAGRSGPGARAARSRWEAAGSRCVASPGPELREPRARPAELRLRGGSRSPRPAHPGGDRLWGFDPQERPEPRALPPEQFERSVSKSAVSRRFVALTRKQMTAWLTAPLEGHDIRVLAI